METLPDEIYEIICGKLSARDLKNAMLVDRYSRFIIESSPVLMEKLPLFVTDNDNDEFCDSDIGKLIEPLLFSRRKVVKLIVELKREKIMNYFVIFKTFGDSIRFLEIKSYAFETVDQLRIILRYLRNLQSLKLFNVAIQKPENKILNSIVQVPKLSLLRLRHVDCVNSDPKIFSLFTNNHDVKLRTIRLRSSDAQSFNYADFTQMMNHQMHLKQLTIVGLSSNNCDVFESGGFLKCQLESLIVKNCKITFSDHYRNLIQLIKSQRSLTFRHLPTNLQQSHHRSTS